MSLFYCNSRNNFCPRFVCLHQDVFQQRDDTFMDAFQNQKYFPAIYTHCYDTSGTRLFAAGGPLQCGLKVMLLVGWLESCSVMPRTVSVIVILMKF